MSFSNLTDPTVTVENEIQKITIGSSVSTNGPEKPTISIEKEKLIIDEIEKHCRNWRKIANVYIASILIFGVAAVSTSVLVSIYTGAPESVMKITTIKTLACISTISLAILTAFNLVSNSGNARNAWKSLNSALMMYTAGSISIQQLIEQYQKGESQLGNVSFNYGTNTNGEKPATYSHDIIASDEERKQKEAANTAKKQKENFLAQENGSPAPEKLLKKPAANETQEDDNADVLQKTETNGIPGQNKNGTA